MSDVRLSVLVAVCSLYQTNVVPKYESVCVYTYGTGKQPLALVLKVSKAMKNAGLSLEAIHGFAQAVRLEMSIAKWNFDIAVRLCQKWTYIAKSPSHRRELLRKG